ncbi:MAG: HEPN domain-containing protein [Candidatus Coatesbacteria bacterium]|nr:HEPN domain-containing protein [Candidatus Coatesbacteria bacterium]
MTSIPEQWVERAQYDLETARAMLKSGRFLYVLFCCQQAVEKMLKGVITKRTEALPPRIHNLIRLAEHAGLELHKEQADSMRALSGYYIETRYPDEIAALSRDLSRQTAQQVLNGTEAMVEWLSSMI